MLRGIKKDWKKIILRETKKSYFKELIDFLDERYKTEEVFPPKKEILNVFKLCDFNDVKVVIIGQDPYHGPGQAHGLSFSVKPGNKVPPSLKNIYKELLADLNIKPVEHGHLEKWARQGVLLLNSVFTVEKGKPASHRKKGWEEFSSEIIKELNENHQSLVFILWGNDAKKKGESIDRKKHLVLESAHPSPFSVKNFQGNKHFSKTNSYLKKNNIKAIDWNLN